MSNLEIRSQQSGEGSVSGPIEKHKRLFISTILTHEKISQQRSGSPSNTNFNNASIENTDMEAKHPSTLSEKNSSSPINLTFL